MKSWFKNKWNKGKMLAELKPALFLSLTFCFMIFIYYFTTRTLETPSIAFSSSSASLEAALSRSIRV